MVRSIIPNLFIIGAMKSGTTSLHRYLASHPQIFMSEPKEPGFFVRELSWSKGWDWYLSLFAEAKGAVVVGESSTHYTKLPEFEGVAERIHEFNPEARLIYLMRDPLDRIVSQYWQAVRSLQNEAERRSILSAVIEDERYVAFSDYAMQLEPYMALFNPEQIHTITFESLTTDPKTSVEHILRWLQLEPDIPTDVFERAWNTRPQELKKARGGGHLNRLRHSRLWDQVAPAIPRWIKAFGNRLAEENIRPDQEKVDQALKYLRPLLLERTAALTELLGHTFPEWKTLYKSDPALKTLDASAPGGTAGGATAEP